MASSTPITSLLLAAMVLLACLATGAFARALPGAADAAEAAAGGHGRSLLTWRRGWGGVGYGRGWGYGPAVYRPAVYAAPVYAAPVVVAPVYRRPVAVWGR
jgi:hypothetical protein